MLQPKDCYLHIIDPQERLLTQIFEAEKVVDGIARMIHIATILSLPILANTQYKKGLGCYPPAIEELVQGVPRPDKVEFNAVANRKTNHLLDTLPQTVTHAVLVGVETHICIYQTAMGLLDLGMTPLVIADAVSSRTASNKELGLKRLEAMGVGIVPMEMLVYELLEKAGTSDFKAVLPHIL